MKPRAIIFDVYGTLLQLLPAPTPAEAEAGWVNFHRQWLGMSPSRTWEAHRADVREEVLRRRTESQSRGIPHPEVVWNEILEASFPEWRSIATSNRLEASVALAALTHRVRVFEAAGPFLKRLSAEGIYLGIASNAQPYTEVELAREWVRVGAEGVSWVPELCFWSWRHGFAKPDAHVFRCLDVRLRDRGLWGDEVLMVGDRWDNDIEPARALGWRGWHLASIPQGDGGGDWDGLVSWWNRL